MPNWQNLVAQLDPERPVLLAGPTASGKSAFAIAIARAQGGIIVNADALQVFSCWNVLTARPSPAEMATAPHHLYGHIAQAEPYSVGHWLREVAPLLRAHTRPIIVGGTGLYFSALTTGLAEIPAIPPEVRAEADQRLHAAGLMAGLAAMIADLDPATTARIDPQNPARVQRAWEVWRATGRGLAEWQAATGAPLLPLAQATALVLSPARDRLAARIDARFDTMMAAGALDEVRAALPHWNPTLPSARAIGASELVAHLRGDIDLATAVERAKAGSRQYAKRQRTWARSKLAAWRWIETP